MIFSGLEFMGETPFHHVQIHGIVRDEQGRKMSKSLGNGIDPLDVIDRTGADALRFALVSGTALGIDQRLSDEKIEAGRNFVNKIWNAHRFVLMNFEDDLDFNGVDPDRYTMEDRWILSRFNSVAAEVAANLEKYETGLALGKVYGFLWEEYCDRYIEMTKPRLVDQSAPGRLEAQYVLNRVLAGAMQLLHPFMPFVTEAIYQNLIHPAGSIVVSEWPVFDPALDRPDEEKRMGVLMDAVRALRNLRSGLGVPPSRKAGILVVSQDEDVRGMFTAGAALLERLASVSSVDVRTSRDGIPSTAVTAVFGGGEIFVPLEDLIDIGKEIERLKQERELLDKEIERVGGKLANAEFAAKAPAKVLDIERDKLTKYGEMREAVLERLKGLGA
jgi:valyl-tRNA synthetase